MTEQEARKELKTRISKNTMFVFDFWMGMDISDIDIKKFAKDKILFSMRKIGMLKDEIDRLIAFQYACAVKGLTDHAHGIEIELGTHIKKLYQVNPATEYEDIKAN